VLSQACIASASVALGLASESTEISLFKHGAAKDRPSIVSSCVAFYARAFKAPHRQWPDVAVTRSLFIESVGPAISKLFLVDLIAERSLQNTGAAITLPVATIDMSTATQRMMLACTCHSSVSAVVSCLPSGATSYCCRGKDTNELLCTSDPIKTTTYLLVECTNEHDVLWLRFVFTVASGACQCHSCQCATLQRTSAYTETFTKRLPRLNHATACVSSQCWCFTADPVTSTGH
jgi:hypothetical protein